ncbi:IS6 family transposase [Yersinia enterocolitica]|nr:IS6 family transposase [Yersinia enterocolitica]MBX9494437.1 IS6 family transposase [Yersinia enterocolitica]
MSLIRKAFRRLHYPTDVIAQCIRWYLAYSLSLRNQEEMMAERGIVIDHSTLHRWVIRLVPLLDKVFRRHKRSVGRRWRMDETYIKVKVQWKYLYRAVDTSGQTIDKSGANTAALTTLNADKPEEDTITVRQNKYLNNLIEQDYRNIKRRIRLMLGFKSFRRAQTILAGIELIHMMRKG